MEETPDRWRITKLTDGVRKHHITSLRPASLFRSVGPMGLSASLPPHRRLRSIIHKTPNASTFLGQSDHPWTGRPGRRFLSDSAVSGGSKHHHPHKKPLSSFTFSDLTQEKPLPNITVKKTSIYQTLQTSPKKHKEVFINKPKLLVDVSRSRLDPTGGDASPVKHTETEYFYEEVWRRERQKVRWTRVKRNTRDEVSDIGQSIQRLEITDQSRSDGQMEFRRRGGGNRAVPSGKDEEHTRRDRRPHFLPPITQRDCLLNVPLTLPDNSPPPSPCSPSDVLFFPLSVPQIQPFPLRRETHQ